MKDKEKQIEFETDREISELLNQALDQRKIIEQKVEMQNIVCKRLCNYDCEKCDFYNKNACVQKDNVDILYEQGYRKLPEDSVVLSREEYIRLQLCELKSCERPIYLDRERIEQEIVDKYNEKLQKHYVEQHKRLKEKISKETAEKFLNMIYWKAVKHIKGKNKDECFIEISFEKLDEIAKSLGVEIKE